MKKPKSPLAAAILSIIPGFGQLYNGEAIKGIAFLFLDILFAIEMYAVGYAATVSFITLGTVPREDNSLFLLIQGVMQLIVMLIFILIIIISMRDAFITAKKINRGAAPNTSFSKLFRAAKENSFPYVLTAPAVFVIIIAVIFPVLVTVSFAFTNYSFRNIPPAKLLDWIGFDNFTNIFMFESYRVTFITVLTWNIIWTLLASTLPIALGIFTAIVCDQKFVRLKRLYGVIFLLPWAIPSFITVLTFANMFNVSYGAVNTQVIPLLNRLFFLNIGEIPWKSDPLWTKTALILIKTWSGFPFIYVLVSGILKSISPEIIEAAIIDGAGPLQRFARITFPHIMLIATPVFVSQYVGNFNNFNTIYLFNGGGPGTVGNGAGTTDILISWVYKMSSNTTPQYSLVAAILLIITVIVVSMSLLVFWRTKALDMEG